MTNCVNCEKAVCSGQIICKHCALPKGVTVKYDEAANVLFVHVPRGMIVLTRHEKGE